MDAEAWTSWGGTALLALAAVVGACLPGIPAGWALARQRGAARRLLLALTVAQAVLPTTFSAIGWISTFGTRGTLTGALAAAGIPLPSLYTPAGVCLVWAWSFWPLVALGTWAGLARSPAALEEAGLLHLPPWRVALAVSLPRALPALLASGAVAWMLMLGDLGVPGCLLVPVGAERVHAQFSATWDVRRTLADSLPVLPLCAVAVWAGWRGFRDLGAPGPAGGAPKMRSLDRAVARAAWMLVLPGFAVPVLGLAGWALQGEGMLRAASRLAGEGTSTLALAAGAGALGAAGAFAAATVLTQRPRAMAALALLTAVPFALPGTLVGMGLIGALNAEGWRGGLYGTRAMPLLAALLRSAAPPLLLAWRALASLPPSYGEAARLLGLPAWRRAVSISLPLCLPSVLAGGLVAAVVASGEVAATPLVSPPGFQTLAVRLFSMVHYGANAVVGAATLAGMAAVMALGLALSFLRVRA